MIGNKRDGHDQQVSPALSGESNNGAMQRRGEPLGGADLALVAEMPPTAPSAALPYQVCRSLNLALVRVSVLDYGNRYTVRAEDEVRISRIGEAGQCFVDPCHDRLYIERV